jgi:hypothetical protein
MKETEIMTPFERAAHAVEIEISTHCPACEAELPGDREEIVRAVRAVLTAIREPGKAALSAGIAAAEDVEDWTQDSYERYRVDSASDMPRPVWQAMIDAMLAEGGR